MDPDPDFSGSDPDFQPIRTQEKQFDLEKNPDPKYRVPVPYRYLGHQKFLVKKMYKKSRDNVPL